MAEDNTEAEEDMRKGFAQLVKDATDETFHPSRPHELNLKYAQKRINAMHGKAAKESAELSQKQISVLEHLKNLADKQDITNEQTKMEMGHLNTWMLRLTGAGAVFALIGLILAGWSLKISWQDRYQPIEHPQRTAQTQATTTDPALLPRAPEVQVQQPALNKATPDSPAPVKTP